MSVEEPDSGGDEPQSGRPLQHGLIGLLESVVPSQRIAVKEALCAPAVIAEEDGRSHFQVFQPAADTP